MTFPRGLAGLALACLAASAFAVEPLPVYEPDPTQADAGRLDGETWIKETPAAADVRDPGRLVDAGERDRRRSGLEYDPFATAPGNANHFITFHVLVENRTEKRMVFQPGTCRMETSYRDSEGPIDYPTIVTAFAMGDRPAPPQLERVRAAILDGEIVLSAGEKRDGLLVYRTLDPHAKRYHVEVNATLTDGSRFGFSAHFKKRKA